MSLRRIYHVGKRTLFTRPISRRRSVASIKAHSREFLAYIHSDDGLYFFGPWVRNPRATRIRRRVMRYMEG